jgi:hypothetical protein
LDLLGVARDLLDSLRDGIAVNASKRNDPHNEEIERTLRKVELVVCFLHAYGFYIYNASCRRSRYIRHVNAPRPALCKTDSEIGLTAVQNIPLNGRNFVQLVPPRLIQSRGVSPEG